MNKYKLTVFKQFLMLLKERKKLFLAPLIIVLLLFGFLVVFVEGSAFAPFIYVIF